MNTKERIRIIEDDASRLSVLAGTMLANVAELQRDLETEQSESKKGLAGESWQDVEVMFDEADIRSPLPQIGDLWKVVSPPPINKQMNFRGLSICGDVATVEGNFGYACMSIKTLRVFGTLRERPPLEKE